VTTPRGNPLTTDFRSYGRAALDRGAKLVAFLLPCRADRL
jgi:hypothetical protein